MSGGVVCVDASVAVKWLIPERDSDRAVALLTHSRTGAHQLVGPSHLIQEVTSAILKKMRLGEIEIEQARTLSVRAGELMVEIVSPPTLPLRAFEIAARFNLKWIYDAFYVALAEIVECELWTADERLHEIVSPAFPNVRLLTEYSAAAP